MNENRPKPVIRLDYQSPEAPYKRGQKLMRWGFRVSFLTAFSFAGVILSIAFDSVHYRSASGWRWYENDAVILCAMFTAACSLTAMSLLMIGAWDYRFKPPRRFHYAFHFNFITFLLVAILFILKIHR